MMRKREKYLPMIDGTEAPFIGEVRCSVLLPRDIESQETKKGLSKQINVRVSRCKSYNFRKGERKGWLVINNADASVGSCLFI